MPESTLTQIAVPVASMRRRFEMNGVNFHPYVGPIYRTEAVRLLIVGESHYGEPDDDPTEATRTVVEKWRSGEWAVRYLTIAARILTGLEAWQIDRRTALNGTAFYNFVQVNMSEIGTRPTVAEARASWDAFRAVLDACDPTHILVTGTGFLWPNMPPSDQPSGDIDLAGTVLPRRQYRTPSGYANAVVIPHLSRMSALRWQTPIREFLARASQPAAADHATTEAPRRSEEVAT